MEDSTGVGDAPTSPPRVSEITPSWLTDVLRAHGLDVTVSDVRRTGMAEGVGMMSSLARLEISYSDGDGPAVIIAKYPAENEANLAVSTAFDLYGREVLFYRDLAERSAAWTPTVFLAELAEDGVGFLLLMEDLGRFRIGDQVEGCGLEEASGAMVWMGRHHASFWGIGADPSVEFLPAVSPSYSSEALTQGCSMGWDPMAEAFADVLPERYRDLKDRYLAALPALFDWMATEPVTVVHGDVRMDNLFFGVEPDHPSLVAVDWQGALRGRAVQDLAYFMAGSVRTDVRRAHERELVEQWRQELLANGVTGYSAEDAWEDYRRGVAYVWVIAVVVAGTLDRTNERAREWMAVMLERSVATMDDLQIIELLDDLT